MNEPIEEPTTPSPDAGTDSEPEELTPLMIEPTIRIPAETSSSGPVWWIEPSNPELDPAAVPPPDGQT